jgi:hypothetical protein
MNFNPDFPSVNEVYTMTRRLLSVLLLASWIVPIALRHWPLPGTVVPKIGMTRNSKNIAHIRMIIFFGAL